MKNRNGFVSNSSSSSFIIPLVHLNGIQIEQIENHIEEGNRLGIPFADQIDAWSIWFSNGTICGETSMNNFDMNYFLNAIGVPDSVIVWEHD
jgi:hypothetical protein